MFQPLLGAFSGVGSFWSFERKGPRTHVREETPVRARTRLSSPQATGDLVSFPPQLSSLTSYILPGILVARRITLPTSFLAHPSFLSLLAPHVPFLHDYRIGSLPLRS